MSSALQAAEPATGGSASAADDLSWDAHEQPPFIGEHEVAGALRDLLDDASSEHVLRELRTAQMELHAIFVCYAMDADGDEAKLDATDSKTGRLGRAAWKQLCVDCGIDGSTQTDDSFIQTDSEKLSEIGFMVALVRLAGKVADRTQSIVQSLYTLLYEYILPFARRGSFAAHSQALSNQSNLLPYLDEIRASFSGFGAQAFHTAC